MTPAERLSDTWGKVLDMIVELDDRMKPHLEGYAPEYREPNAMQHMVWFERELAKHEQQYPKQWYMTEHGPRFASLWLLTRAYVTGWEDEFKRYQRETRRETQRMAA